MKTTQDCRRCGVWRLFGMRQCGVRRLSGLRQRGLGMAELLVAMALGLVVLLGAGTLLIGSTRAHAALLQATEMDDSGRYAVDALARAVRLAAHVDWERQSLQDPAAPARIAGLDARSLTRTGAGLAALAPDAANGSDVLAVRFAGSGAPPRGDGATVDCAGFPVHRDEEGWSIFYVARNAQGEAELRCKYKGASAWSSDAVAGKVDSFQVLYGLDLDGDGAPERYLNAGAIAALDAALPLAGATAAARAAELNEHTHWKRIAAVRIGLLLYGPRIDADLGGAIVHELFGPAYGKMFAAADRGTRLPEAALGSGRGAGAGAGASAGAGGTRMRKVFGATIALPVAPR